MGQRQRRRRRHFLSSLPPHPPCHPPNTYHANCVLQASIRSQTAGGSGVTDTAAADAVISPPYPHLTGGGTSQHDVIACILLQPEHNHMLTFSFRRQLLPNVFTDGHHRKRPSIKSRDAFFTGIQAALSTFSRLTYGALKPCNNSNI